MSIKIDQIIKKSNKIILSTHEKPDADGLGSCIAFYYYLKSINKDVQIIQPSQFPEDCNIINPDNIVETFTSNSISSIKSCDLLILFDVGHYTRARDVSEIAIKNNIDIVSIDHHKNTKTDTFKAFLIDVDAPATGFLVWKLLNDFKFKKPWNLKISNALYAALMTDTGSFRYNNTTSKAHDMASELLSFGVKPYDIYVPFYEERSIKQLRLLSYVIDNIKFTINDKVCYAILDEKAFKNTNAKIEDVDGFTEFLRAIKGVEISFLITDHGDDTFRVNFRSKGNFTVNDIASNFKGGGHKFAAGCKVSNSNVIELEKKIVNLLDIKMRK